jgi:isopentenyl-diphosphate Delta-isomerase
MDEQVVLVDERDQELGVANKAEVHGKRTPLHRAFSVFLFNTEGQVLAQQRAKSKKTWPGIWSNSCCGHPSPGESYEEAILRRVKEELGVEIVSLEKVSDYRYRFERDGVVENELCPVYRGIAVGEPQPLSSEVEDWKWMTWDELLNELITDRDGVWSEWCKEEVSLFTA